MKEVRRRKREQNRANTTTTTTVTAQRSGTIFRWLPPHRRRSPSYNLLVNFASLLEGYVRWNKKYPEWCPSFSPTFLVPSHPSSLLLAPYAPAPAPLLLSSYYHHSSQHQHQRGIAGTSTNISTSDKQQQQQRHRRPPQL